MHLDLAKLRKEWKKYHRESEEISERIMSLIELGKLKGDKSCYEDWMYKVIGSRIKKSERTIYRWAERYKNLGAEGLRPKKPPGKKKTPISGWTAFYIKMMRDDYKWGAEVIQAHLRLDYGIEVSEYRIHEFLKRRGYIGRKRRKIKKNKHTQKVQVQVPGQHTQIDVKHTPRLLKNGRKCYVYNFVDHASKWQFKMAFEGLGAWETYRFLQALFDACPFKILRIQSDNGSEFTYRHLHFCIPDDPAEHPMEHICKVYGIKKRLIPAGEKELNGLVERSHRMDDEELYQTIRPVNVRHFNQLLKTHTKWLMEFPKKEVHFLKRFGFSSYTSLDSSCQEPSVFSSCCTRSQCIQRPMFLVHEPSCTALGRSTLSLVS